MLDAYLAWAEVSRQRRALLALSDDMLKGDIGISRSQADFEGEQAILAELNVVTEAGDVEISLTVEPACPWRSSSMCWNGPASPSAVRSPT